MLSNISQLVVAEGFQVVWNEGLDEECIPVVEYEGSYSCVIAGAGTGKSFALKRKIARLLEQGEPPSSLLVVTFTRTAARDLKNDLEELGVEGCDIVRACTLHSLCLWILSRHEVFRVMERKTRTLLGHEIDYLIADLSVRLERKIKILREQLHAFTSAWARLLNEEPGWPHSDEDREFDNELISWLRFHKAMLVGELVPLTIEYLRNNPTSPERSLYKHMTVDEYQDLNKAEQRLIRLLSEYKIPENRTLTVAGDDDQSIFVTLKYAHPEGITNFKEEYPGTFETTLVTCKRCPRRVIELANVFLKSTKRKEKPKLLQPAPNAIKGEVAILQWRTPNDEASGVATIIAKKISAGEVKPGEIIVLTPRKQIGYAIKNNLIDRGIGAQTCFSEAVLYSKQAQEGYAYLNLLHERNDAVSLRVLLGIYAADKRRKSYEKIRRHCFESGDAVIETLSKLKSGELHIPSTDHLVAPYQIICQRLQYLSTLTVPEVIEQLFPDGVDEVAEIRKLVMTAMEGAGDIHELYDMVNREITQPELPKTSDSILILTLQKAKGLTAKMVVFVNCLEGCIPYVGRYDSKEEQEKALAEQERLFFVALTRTTNILLLSSTGIMRRGDAARMKVRASARRYWPETEASRFIDMLGPNAPSPQPGDDYIRHV
ncbi:MAG TPA: ATP-dependent helicase [Dehalococcoidia bacterium]|nr:ATP-dependent helicase [Dehalococcoidia bacterium]